MKCFIAFEFVTSYFGNLILLYVLCTQHCCNPKWFRPVAVSTQWEYKKDSLWGRNYLARTYLLKTDCGLTLTWADKTVWRQESAMFEGEKYGIKAETNKPWNLRWGGLKSFGVYFQTFHKVAKSVIYNLMSRYTRLSLLCEFGAWKIKQAQASKHTETVYFTLQPCSRIPVGHDTVINMKWMLPSWQSRQWTRDRTHTSTRR